MDYHYAPAAAAPPSWSPHTTSGQHSEVDAQMDINELMGDIGGSSNSLSYAPYQPPGNTYYAPFNSSSYSASPQWPSQSSPTSTAFPLSTYSSLNGATSSSNITSMTSQSPPLPQGSPHPGHNQDDHNMAIDPSLMSLNGNSSHGSHQGSTSQSPPNNRPFHYQNAPLANLSLDQLTQLYRYNPQLFQQTSQQTTPYQSLSFSQGTLSPQALMNPSGSGAIQPSHFYTQPSPTSVSPTTPTSVSGPDLVERRKQFQASITPMLAPNAFTGAGAVNTLVGRILEYGLADIDANMRMEILGKIRDGAGNHYFRAWGENSDAMDITREWLKAGFSSGNGNPLMETVMPLLQIIDRIPLTLDGLKASKLGRLVVKLTKEPPTPAVKDMASNLERRWRQMLAPPKSEDEDVKTKKRKSPETLPTKAAPPAKKAAVGTASSSKPQSSSAASKPRSASTSTPAKEVKSDTSFFSAPKPKPKLPSFKKAPAVPVKKEETAQPSAVDPFQEALALMKGKRTGSPSGPVPVSTPTLPSMPNVAPSSSAVIPPAKLGKKKKSVTWAPDSELEKVKLIEPAVYDDDGETHTAHHNLRALDRGEGAALHLSEEDNAFEESIDYSEPLAIEIPENIQNPPLGDLSEEKKTQEQRESSTLSALYMSPLHIPESPAELTFTLTDEDIDKDMKQMTAGVDADAVFWAPTPAEVPLQPQQVPQQLGAVSSVSELLANLTGALQQTNNTNTTNMDPSSIATANNFMQSLPAEQFQALMAQFQNPMGGVAPPAQPQQDWSGWQSADTDNGGGEQWFDGGDNGGKGRGGRGRGRGRGGGGSGGGREGGGRPYRKKQCIFYMEGRCKYGDQCDFVHDMPPGS